MPGTVLCAGDSSTWWGLDPHWSQSQGQPVTQKKEYMPQAGGLMREKHSAGGAPNGVHTALGVPRAWML